MFTFTPLLGAHSTSNAVQSILAFDGGIKVLIGLGWDDTFDAKQLQSLEKQIASISIILLTHPTLSHLGAYAHCCKHFPLFRRIPVYATAPVIALGRLLLQDLYSSSPLASSSISPEALTSSGISQASSLDNVLLPPPTPDDISDYFSAIIPLKYSQPHQPSPSQSSPSLSSLTITAYRAGHTLGGTIWHLQHASESVVYAVDWNQARENVLAGAAWLSSAGGNEIVEQLRRPTALICDAKNSEMDGPGGGWKTRDSAFVDSLREAISNKSSVLVPCDTSARALELLYVLDQAWTHSAADGDLRASKLYFVSKVAINTIRHARTMGEWMDDTIRQEFENTQERADQRRNTKGQTDDQDGPFDFKHVQVIEKRSQLDKALSAEGPKVFLASDISLSWGYSKVIAETLFRNPGNHLIVPDGRRVKIAADAGDKSSFLDSIIAHCRDLQVEGYASKAIELTCQFDNPTIDFTSLEPNEERVYQSFIAQQRQTETAVGGDRMSTVEADADVIDDASSSSESEDEEEEDAEHNQRQGKALTASATSNQYKAKSESNALMSASAVLLRKKDVHDYDVRGQRGRLHLFPYVEKRVKQDEYGEVIRAEDFLRADEREDPADLLGQNDAKLNASENIGHKRRWNASGSAKVAGGLDGSKKRKMSAKDFDSGDSLSADQVGGQDVEGEDSDESDYEPAEPMIIAPRKVTRSSRSFNAFVTISTVDYSALHDRRALQMLIPLINPQKLIFTAALATETTQLAEDCRRLLDELTTSDKELQILLPLNGSTVDASVDMNAWTLKLSKSLYRKLDWQMIDAGHGIVTLSGKLDGSAKGEQSEREAADAKRRKTAQASSGESGETGYVGIDEEVVPMLDSLPANILAGARAMARLHVGDMRLPDFRRLVQAQGHIAEFKGEGTLLVDGFIVVRKSATGRIVIESAASGQAGVSEKMRAASYRNVLGQIYRSLAVVSAR